MAVREILKLGHPVLRRVARPMTAEEAASSETRQLVEDMVDTLHAAGGIGLAAPQVGVSRRLAIIEIAAGGSRYGELEPMPLTVFVNPEIEVIDERTQGYWEGCLSVPGLRGVVPRHRRIRYQGFDPLGKPIDREAEGFHARVVQHECDHLFGTLYPMRVRDFSRFGYTDVLFPELTARPD